MKIKKPKKINLTRQNRQRRKLIRDAKKIWEQLIRDEYGESCELCGKLGNTVHHFMRKSIFGHLRFYLKNGIIICMGCHISRVETPLGIEDLRKKRGEEWYKDIMYQAKNPPKNFKVNMKWLKEELERLKELQNSS